MNSVHPSFKNSRDLVLSCGMIPFDLVQRGEQTSGAAQLIKASDQDQMEAVRSGCESAPNIGSDAILMTGNLAIINFEESIQGNGIATEQSYRALCCVGLGTGASAENR